MSKFEMRMVEVCPNCNELIEHCLCDTEETCDEECCGCCNCEEFEDEVIEQVRIIETFADLVENIECTCGAELRNILYDLFLTGVSIGKKNHQDFIRECNED